MTSVPIEESPAMASALVHAGNIETLLAEFRDVIELARINRCPAPRNAAAITAGLADIERRLQWLVENTAEQARLVPAA